MGKRYIVKHGNLVIDTVNNDAIVFMASAPKDAKRIVSLMNEIDSLNRRIIALSKKKNA